MLHDYLYFRREALCKYIEFICLSLHTWRGGFGLGYCEIGAVLTCACLLVIVCGSAVVYSNHYIELGQFSVPFYITQFNSKDNFPPVCGDGADLFGFS